MSTLTEWHIASINQEQVQWVNFTDHMYCRVDQLSADGQPSVSQWSVGCFRFVPIVSLHQFQSQRKWLSG